MCKLKKASFHYTLLSVALAEHGVSLSSSAVVRSVVRTQGEDAGLQHPSTTAGGGARQRTGMARHSFYGQTPRV